MSTRRLLPLLLLLAGTALAQDDVAEAERALGRAAFEAGKYEDALAHFLQARDLRPDDWRGHAYAALTIVQIAGKERDLRRREELLREAEAVAGELVKRHLIEFHDPLYRLVRGLCLSIRGDAAKAHAILKEAMRAPREKLLRYEEVNLRSLLERAYAVSGVEYATSLIMLGGFEEADQVLEDANRRLLPGDAERRVAERLLAVTSEQLGKREKAVGHIRTCIALSKDDPWTVHELIGTIALIQLSAEDLEAGRKALTEAPADSRHPLVVAARCTLVTREAMHDNTKLDEAIAYVREAMRGYPPDDVHMLVRLYKDLVLTKVSAREAQTPEGRALLEGAIAICKHEIDLRPECPPFYFAVYRMHKLLGNTEEELRFQELHERKKKEWEHKEKYDHRGRPRCGD